MKTIIWRARGILLAVVSAAAAGACGGEAGPTSPPPPGPPPPPPGPTIGASLNLRPGEVHILSERDAIRAFEIQGAAEGREYQVIVMSASLSEGRTTPLRVRARADDVSPNVVPNPRTNRGGRDAAIPPARGLAGELRPDRDWHLRQMIETERELRRLRARPAGGIGRASRGLAAAISDVPRVGDTLTVRSAIVPGGGVQCTANTPIKSTVRTVGEHFIIVEDDRLAGRFTEEDYADLDRELDEFIAPVSHEYFGEPEDLDGNQRVIAFFTGEVNRLSEPESGSVVIGFHWIGNLFERENCPASNEAEIVWLIGPDPDAEFGIEIGADFVKRVARSLVAHEYQHLLNASQRLGGQRGQNTWGNADLWVNEGLSHVAEEVTGFYRQGLRVRGNYPHTELIARGGGGRRRDDGLGRRSGRVLRGFGRGRRTRGAPGRGPVLDMELAATVGGTADCRGTRIDGRRPAPAPHHPDGGGRVVDGRVRSRFLDGPLLPSAGGGGPSLDDRGDDHRLRRQRSQQRGGAHHRRSYALIRRNRRGVGHLLAVAPGPRLAIRGPRPSFRVHRESESNRIVHRRVGR